MISKIPQKNIWIFIKNEIDCADMNKRKIREAIRLFGVLLCSALSLPYFQEEGSLFVCEMLEKELQTQVL